MAAYTDSYIVSDDISQITYRIQKNESDRARFSFVLRRERDSRAPTSLRSPTSNAFKTRVFQNRLQNYYKKCKYTSKPAFFSMINRKTRVGYIRQSPDWA